MNSDMFDRLKHKIEERRRAEKQQNHVTRYVIVKCEQDKTYYSRFTGRMTEYTDSFTGAWKFLFKQGAQGMADFLTRNTDVPHCVEEVTVNTKDTR